MKKVILIISSIVLLLAVVIGGLSLYIVNSPEYALKNIVEDVNTSGMEGLVPHLTEKAEKTLDRVSSVTENGLVNTIMGFIDQNDYVSVLQSDIQEIQWEVDEVLKSEDNAAVILSFNYADKVIGTVEISMIRDEGEWKIDGIKFPVFKVVIW